MNCLQALTLLNCSNPNNVLLLLILMLSIADVIISGKRVFSYIQSLPVSVNDAGQLRGKRGYLFHILGEVHNNDEKFSIFILGLHLVLEGDSRDCNKEPVLSRFRDFTRKICKSLTRRRQVHARNFNEIDRTERKHKTAGEPDVRYGSVGRYDTADEQAGADNSNSLPREHFQANLAVCCFEWAISEPAECYILNEKKGGMDETGKRFKSSHDLQEGLMNSPPRLRSAPE
ncbi:hypothetical protein J6590_067010 [Homalodisca vitripennis]|nr:hypothetical protein J6590_067010 [Homalodisca vitripennis]